MNFQQDLRDEVMKWLPRDSSDPSVTAELSALHTGELIIRFFNWLSRLIHPHPRQVLRSQQYIFRRMLPREQVYLERIVEKIETGADLSPHLTRGVAHGFVQRAPATMKKNLGRRRDLDLLLNEWGIHHLHLPDVLDNDGFVRRDPVLDRNLLLFAIFQADKAYLLDVSPHGEWTNERLVAIAVRNWPNARLFWSLNALGPAQAVTQDDRQKLRSVGVTTPIQVDGKVFIAATGGITTAGTATQSVLRANNLLRALTDIERKIAADPGYFRPQVENSGWAYPENPEFHAIFIRTPLSWEFAIREEVTGCVIRIGV